MYNMYIITIIIMIIITMIIIIIINNNNINIYIYGQLFDKQSVQWDFNIWETPMTIMKSPFDRSFEARCDMVLRHGATAWWVQRGKYGASGSWQSEDGKTRKLRRKWDELNLNHHLFLNGYKLALRFQHLFAVWNTVPPETLDKVTAPTSQACCPSSVG